MTFHSADFKQNFPLFSHPENSRLVYLDNAATTQRPQCVIDAIVDYYSRYNANTHRSSHRLARAATEMVERVRQQAAEFINAKNATEIIFTRGATESLNLLASSLSEEFTEGDEIVLSSAEHHANLVPWQMAAERHGLTLIYLPDVNGVPQLDALPKLMNERTRLISLTLASNALGFQLDCASIKPILPEGCRLIVDASQLMAHRTVDVQALGCDFLVASAHKFYGPTGIGILYGRQELLNSLPPWQGGGEMISRVGLFDSDYAAAPHRFEAGTSALAAIAGLGACLTFLQSQPREQMAIYENHLNRYLHTELQALTQTLPLQLLTRFENNVGIASLVPAAGSAFTAMDLGDWLDAHDIAVRVGHHCAQPLMNQLQQTESLRISLAAYNHREDIDRLIQVLTQFPFQAAPRNSHLEDSGGWPADDLSSASLDDLIVQTSWQKRYRQLTRWAALMKPKPAIRLDENRVRGCESEVWMVHRCEGQSPQPESKSHQPESKSPQPENKSHQGESQRHRFAIDTDSRVLQGLSVLLLLLIDNKTADEIAAVDFDRLFADFGLEKYLSPSRSNGFRALVNRAIELSV